MGKSTTTAALVGALREQGRRVGVLAVDPSSPFSGGALLGDRVRMQAHALDPGVYIRSMATRGHLGGLAVAAPQALRVLDAAGFDVVLLETVGVGQSEIEVADLADTTLVLLAPGMGDGVQAAKAGILEIGDIFVVNKSDRDGAQALIRELRGMVALGEREPDAWKPPIVATVAHRGEGIDDLLGRIEQFRATQQANGEWTARRVARARREVEGLVLARLQAELALDPGAGLDALAEAVSRGELDAYTAADRFGRCADAGPRVASAWRSWWHGPRTVERTVQNSGCRSGGRDERARSRHAVGQEGSCWCSLVGFVLFYLIQRPESAAGAVRTVFGAIGRGLPVHRGVLQLTGRVAMPGLFDPNVDQYVLDKAGEYMVLEVRKHWVASLWPAIRLIGRTADLRQRLGLSGADLLGLLPRRAGVWPCRPPGACWRSTGTGS